MKGVKKQMAKVLLGDVVAHIKDKVDKDTTDLEFYVGGEHIDGDEITVRRRGRIEGSTIGPAFHMRFQQGDVLLMSRNPHLRKASMVDFDGICSDVSYVCRTKDNDVLLQSLLPFILQTPEFWQFAEENKKGGLPFFLNWKDFARFEFELIPIERQRQISDLLWAMERVKNAYRELIARTDDLVKSQFIEMFGEPNRQSAKWNTKPFSALTDSFDKSRKPVKEGDRQKMKGPYPYYGATGIVDYVNDYRLDGDFLLISEDGKALEFRNYDIAFIASGKIWVNNHAHVVQCHDEITLNYLRYYFKYLDISKWVTGIDQKKLNRENLDTIPIMVPPREVIDTFDRFVEQSDKSKFAAQQTLKELTDAQKALMKKIFE